MSDTIITLTSPTGDIVQAIKESAIFISSNRQRRDFDPQAMQDLVRGISKRLLHAIVLRETSKGWELSAGERRIKAIRELWILGSQLIYNKTLIPEGYIPYTTLGQLTAIEAEEAEMEENCLRKDLTWQESAAAQQKLHKLRSMQAQAEGRIHTVADTAMEVKGRSDGYFQSSVRTNLVVAKHLDNPLVAKAKTADEAFKILQKVEIQEKNRKLAEIVGKTFTKALHAVHNVDCISWMKSCPKGTFDVILTDPPYGMGADQFDDGAGALTNFDHHYKDDLQTFRDLMSEWCTLAYHVAKEQAHAYVFCDLDNFHELKLMMQNAGWYVFRTPILHTKPGSGRVPLPTEGPRRTYELILYAIKNHKQTTAIYPDIITSTADTGLQHGAQKPIAVYENLLMRSVRAGDKVLDTFGGSGTLLPAAHKFKCAATVLEVNPEYYGICLQRMKDLDKLVDASPAQSQALGMFKGALGGKPVDDFGLGALLSQSAAQP